jgi:hypothetical protein
MCLKLTAVLIKLRRGVQGNIVTQGWPGARATITVQLPNGKSIQRTVLIHWGGSDLLRLSLSTTIAAGLHARVLASARLGHVVGSASARFQILPIR